MVPVVFTLAGTDALVGCVPAAELDPSGRPGDEKLVSLFADLEQMLPIFDVLYSWSGVKVYGNSMWNYVRGQTMDMVLSAVIYHIVVLAGSARRGLPAKRKSGPCLLGITWRRDVAFVAQWKG